MPEDETHVLVERAQGGDGAAFAALYDVFAPRIYRFFRFRVDTAESAEDLTQKVFLKMIEQLPRYEARGIPFAAWVFRVARNAWIDEDRTAHPTVPLGLLPGNAALTVGPHDAAVAAIESETIRSAVETLPPDQRDVIASRFFGGLSCRETAIQLGRSEGSVRVIQHRALAALRKRLPTVDDRLGDAGDADGAGSEVSAT
jgi:RNA polymerase sigma-70 factor (ECF subfamily)